MSVQLSEGIQTVGTCLSIASGCPPSIDLAGFESLSYVGTVEVEGYGEIGGTRGEVSWSSLCPGVVSKRPGVKNYGGQSLVLTHVLKDPAQVLMANHFESGEPVSVRMTYINGDRDFYTGYVMSKPKKIGGDSDHVTRQVLIAINSRVIEVPVVEVLTVAGAVSVNDGKLFFASTSQTVMGETITNHKWTVTVTDPGEPNDGRVIVVDWPDGGVPTVTDSGGTPLTVAGIVGGDSSFCFSPIDIDMLLSASAVISTALEVTDSAGVTDTATLNPISPALSDSLGTPTAAGTEAYNSNTLTLSFTSTSSVVGGQMTGLVYELTFDYPGDVNDGRVVRLEYDNQSDPIPTVDDSRSLLSASEILGNGAAWSLVANAANDFYVPTGVGSITTKIFVVSQFIVDEVTL